MHIYQSVVGTFFCFFGKVFSPDNMIFIGQPFLMFLTWANGNTRLTTARAHPWVSQSEE